MRNSSSASGTMKSSVDGGTPMDASAEATRADLQRWRDLALRRLDRLVSAEHDLDTLRDRLQQSQSEMNAMLVQRERLLLDAQRLAQRVDELERERSAWMASRGWRLLQRVRRLRAYGYVVPMQLRRGVRFILRMPGMRSLKSMMIRVLPGLSLRIHTRLRAGD